MDATGNMPAVTNATAGATAVIQDGHGSVQAAELSTSHLVIATSSVTSSSERQTKLHVYTIDSSGHIPVTATTIIEPSGYDAQAQNILTRLSIPVMQNNDAVRMALSTSHLVIMVLQPVRTPAAMRT
jgi:hypothetical protein